ncbi:MAG: AIM24 family protein [Bacillota bacterium]|nr:AIM24 family protein [Bacillota bacterium]
MFQPDMLDLVKVLDMSQGKGITFEVIQYEKLEGHYDKSAPHRYINKLRQVRAYLNGGELVTESGALQFMKGAINMKVDSSIGSIARGFLGGALTGESSVKPRYTGSGEIYLEPSYSHFLILEMDNEEVVADKGIFYCCEGSIEIGVFTQKNLSSAIAGGEGLFQTKLKGSGSVVLQSKVPFEQVLIYHLNNEKLQVDGNYAILRRGAIEFTVEKSTKSIIGSARSGEGLLQTYRGTGEVWLIPALRFVDGGNSLLSV